MKVIDKESGKERDCCNPRTDFIESNAENIEAIKKQWKKKKIYECIYCGQKWKYGQNGLANTWKAIPEEEK